MGDGGGTVSPGSTKAGNKTNDDQSLVPPYAYELEFGTTTTKIFLSNTFCKRFILIDSLLTIEF